MKRYKFKAKLEAGDSGGAYVLFPYDTEKEFATEGKVPVKATFDGVPYTGSLIKYGQAQHMLGVLKSIREEIGKAPGDILDVVLWKDVETRTVEVPAAFATRMKKEGCSHSSRNSATPIAKSIAAGSRKRRRKKHAWREVRRRLPCSSRESRLRDRAP
jgi:hypothetical protein